jgi:hypothetical protein
MLKQFIVIALVAGALGACSGRFAGFNNCSADGSVVLFEHPNKAGNYEGLNNGPCKR